VTKTSDPSWAKPIDGSANNNQSLSVRRPPLYVADHLAVPFHLAQGPPPIPGVGIVQARQYDVAIIFSQDQDLHEFVQEVARIAKEQSR
jgi:hypothetical protein